VTAIPIEPGEWRLRVAFYQGTFQPGQDGTMTTMVRMADAMWRDRIHHAVFTPLPPKPGQEMRTPVVALRRIPFPAYTDYAIAIPSRRAMWAALDEYRPDLVQVGTPDLGGRMLLRWAMERGVPAIGAYHTHFPTYLRYYRLGFLEPLLWRHLRFVYTNCARTLVPAENVMRELAAHGIGNMVLWPRGVDTQRFRPENRSAAIRAKAGAGADDVLFCYAGRFVDEKNVLLVAEAWRRVRAEMPDARFLWIGDGPRRGRLKALMPEAYFPGYLQGDDLAAHYASADVFVFCSVTEAYGNVVQEAMASGLPAIAVDAAGVGSVVRRSEAGLLAEREDAGEVAALMKRLYGDAALRRALAEKALAFARAQSWESVFRNQFAVYDEVLAERRR
jgi:glycosyltransferase involved in cell wall biosynthesis